MSVRDPPLITKDQAREIVRLVTLSADIATNVEIVNELFGPDYIPGTFTLAERKDNPVFLEDDYGGGYESWVRSITRSHLQVLSRAGLSPVSFDHEYIQAMGDAVLMVLDSSSETGLPLCEQITNQQVTDVVWRILKVLLYGDPYYPLHVFRDFNEMGWGLAIALLTEQQMTSPVMALQRSIAAGALGVDIKSQYSAAGPSPVVHSGIIRMVASNGTLRDLEEIEKDLEARTAEGLAIDFSQELKQEVMDRFGPVLLLFFADDLIETIFDLAVIQLWLEFNDDLTVTVVPRHGQHANDASFDDVKALLRQPLFGYLASLEQTRFFVLPNGPAGSGVNAYELSRSVLRALASADIVILKGARAYEMFQGLRKVTYFAFNVLRSFTESLVGLDATGCPRVLVRQDPGISSFVDFRARACRERKCQSGRNIRVARMTTVEYAAALKSSEFARLVETRGDRGATISSIEKEALSTGKTLAEAILGPTAIGELGFFETK